MGWGEKAGLMIRACCPLEWAGGGGVKQLHTKIPNNISLHIKPCLCCGIANEQEVHFSLRGVGFLHFMHLSDPQGFAQASRQNYEAIKLNR